VSLAAVVLSCASASLSSASAAEPFLAAWSDGTRIAGDRIQGWHESGAPHLAGRPFFDSIGPVRWLIRPDFPAGDEPVSFVEYCNGDRLPGKVIAYRPGVDESYQQSLPYLVVDSPLGIGPPDQIPRSGPFPVLTWGLQRVVWQRVPGRRYTPSTVLLKDGRELSYRSFRWGQESLRLLRPGGIEEISWTQIREFHFPTVDPWEAYILQLAVLAPADNEQLVQIETTQGLRLTTSQARFKALHQGGPDDPNRWAQVVQPAWANRPLWLPFATIRLWRWFAPHEVPLSSLVPSKVEERHSLGGSWPWQTNLNVQSGPLRAAGQEFGWGLGVQAYCRLEFPLAPAVRAFRGKLALDELAADGGCAQGLISLRTKNAETIFRSPILQGSKEAHNVGPLNLPSAGDEPRTLVLETDPVLGPRPVGADPLDIRDTVDWLEPLLELDGPALWAQVRHRAAELMPAWQGWHVAETPGGAVDLRNQWEDGPPLLRGWRSLAVPREKFLTLERTVTISPSQQWLLLAVSRPERDAAASRLQIEIDGKEIERWEVPPAASYRPPELKLLPLQKHLGKTVTLRVQQLPAGPQGLADWRALTFLAHPPGLKPLCEEDPGLVDLLTEGAGQARWQTSGGFLGKGGCLAVVNEARGRARLPNFSLAIRELPALGEFRYLRFAWKVPRGAGACLQFGQDGKFGPAPGVRDPSYRYLVGPAPDPFSGARSLSPDPPRDWALVTRDLYADFGAFQMTGISLVPDMGGEVWLDHVYLARTPSDFVFLVDQVPATGEPAAGE